VGLFVTLTNLLAEKKVNILAVNAHTNKNGVAQILFTIEITSADQLNKIITQIKGLPEIIDTRRVNF
jgi:(p)ppGpp synthase/HD superfamily hydrolase